MWLHAVPGQPRRTAAQVGEGKKANDQQLAGGKQDPSVKSVDGEAIVGVQPVINGLGKPRLVKDDGHGDGDKVGGETHDLGVIVGGLEEAPIALGTQPLLGGTKLEAQAWKSTSGVRLGVCKILFGSLWLQMRTSDGSIAQLEITKVTVHSGACGRGGSSGHAERYQSVWSL